MNRGENCRRSALGRIVLGIRRHVATFIIKVTRPRGGLLLFADITERMLKALIHVRGVIELTHRLPDSVTFMAEW